MPDYCDLCQLRLAPYDHKEVTGRYHLACSRRRPYAKSEAVYSTSPGPGIPRDLETGPSDRNRPEQSGVPGITTGKFAVNYNCLFIK